jgi:hypothetical protein
MKPINFAVPLMALMAFSLKAAAINTWTYHQETDRLTNQNYSFALSPLPQRNLYDELKLEISCNNQQLRVSVDADSLIASQGSLFDVSYQIDQNPPAPIQMKIFPDSKRKGYTQSEAQRMVESILAGKAAIFIRVTTITKDILSGAIPLEGAAQPIQKVLADCGITAGQNTAPAADLADYTLSAFEQDFARLSVGQQQQLLAAIKKLMADLH